MRACTFLLYLFQIKRYYSFKLKHSDVYSGLVPSKEQNIFQQNILTVQPNRDQFGRRILILELGSKFRIFWNLKCKMVTLQRNGKQMKLRWMKFSRELCYFWSLPCQSRRPKFVGLSQCSIWMDCLYHKLLNLLLCLLNELQTGYRFAFLKILISINQAMIVFRIVFHLELRISTL